VDVPPKSKHLYYFSTWKKENRRYRWERKRERDKIQMGEREREKVCVPSIHIIKIPLFIFTSYLLSE
jgi:hypothetical protein